MKKVVVSLCVAIALLMSYTGVFAYEFPHSFWAMNDNYTAAVNSGNCANIPHIRTGAGKRGKILVNRADLFKFFGSTTK